MLMFGSRLPRLELDHRQTAVRRAHETVHGAANADPGLLGWEERKWDFEVALSGCQQGCQLRVTPHGTEQPDRRENGRSDVDQIDTFDSGHQGGRFPNKTRLLHGRVKLPLHHPVNERARETLVAVDVASDTPTPVSDVGRRLPGRRCRNRYKARRFNRIDPGHGAKGRLLLEIGEPDRRFGRTTHRTHKPALVTLPGHHRIGRRARVGQRRGQRRRQEQGQAPGRAPDTSLAIDLGREIQPIARTGDRHVHQPAQLFGFATVLKVGRVSTAKRHLGLSRRPLLNDRHSGRPPPPGRLQVHHEYDGKLEPLRRMHGHQIHRVGGLHDGIRVVTGTKRLEVRGQPIDRGVPAVLHTPNEGTHLLQILPRLIEPAAAKFEEIGRLAQHHVEQFARRHPLCQLEPARNAAASLAKQSRVDITEGHRRRHGRQQRPRHSRRQGGKSHVRQPHESRPQELRRAQIRLGTRQESEQRLKILHLCSVEESQSLVDVRSDTPTFEGVLEVLVTGARPEQDRDVVAPNRPRADLAVADGGGTEQTHDLVGDGSR